MIIYDGVFVVFFSVILTNTCQGPYYETIINEKTTAYVVVYSFIMIPSKYIYSHNRVLL